MDVNMIFPFKVCNDFFFDIYRDYFLIDVNITILMIIFVFNDSSNSLFKKIKFNKYKLPFPNKIF